MLVQAWIVQVVGDTDKIDAMIELLTHMVFVNYLELALLHWHVETYKVIMNERGMMVSQHIQLILWECQSLKSYN